MREERLKAAEKKLNDLKKRGLDGDNEFKFAEMLSSYGNLCEKVDKDMDNWKKGQNEQLEEKLRQRREKRRQEVEEQKKDLESQLNKDTQQQRSRLNNEMSQVEALLKPVKDEDDRLKMVTEDL